MRKEGNAKGYEMRSDKIVKYQADRQLSEAQCINEKNPMNRPKMI